MIVDYTITPSAHSQRMSAQRRVRREASRLLQALQSPNLTENDELGYQLQLCALGVWCADATDQGELATLFVREQGMQALILSMDTCCKMSTLNYSQLASILQAVSKLLRRVQRDTTMYLAVQMAPPVGYSLLHSMTTKVLPALQLALGRSYPYPQHQNHHAAVPMNPPGAQTTSPDQLSDAARKLGVPHQSRHSGSLVDRMTVFPVPNPVLPASASSTAITRKPEDKPLSKPVTVSKTRQLSIPTSSSHLMDDANNKANMEAHALNLYEQVLLCTSLASDIVGTFAAGGEYCATCAFQSKIAHSLLQIGTHVSEKLRKRLGLSEEEGDANEQLHQMARSAARLRAAMGMDERVPKSLRQSRPGYFALKERRGGIRVLSLDGGGSRIIATLQILKKLEQMCGMRIADMFDVIGGTSSGGLLALAMGLRNKSAQQCEQLTMEISNRVFSHGLLARGKVLLNRGQHDTKALESMFRDELGEDSLIDSRANDIHPHLASTNSDSYTHHFHRYGTSAPTSSASSSSQSTGSSPLHRVPMVFAVSTRMGTSSSVPAEPYLHSNYRPPLLSPPLNPNGSTKLPKPPMSRYAHGCHHRIWEAARATTAAPAYFDPLQSGDEVFCDGALCNNNPTAIAVHEARMLFHGVPLELVVSLGCGRADVPQGGEREMQQLVGSGSGIGSRSGRSGDGKGDIVSFTKSDKSVGVSSGDGPRYVGRDVERRSHAGVGESDLALNPEDHKAKTGGESSSSKNPSLPSSSSMALRVHVMAIARALVDSATDTEAVHHAMEDLAPPHVYYRLNPVLPRDWLILDESRPERLEEIVIRTHEYMKEQEGVIRKVCDVLMNHYPTGAGPGSLSMSGNEKDGANGPPNQNHRWWERWKASKL